MKPERVAYWYFRLNGFFQIENFILHPGSSGGQRTDADLIAVRFPFRQELLFDCPTTPMSDDVEILRLSCDRLQVFIVEIKTNSPCTLNGPWTEETKRNINRVLAAVGCLRPDEIDQCASALYSSGDFQNQRLELRLVAIGRTNNSELTHKYPNVIQLTWSQLIEFIWKRGFEYRKQKSDIQQWDEVGKKLLDMIGQKKDMNNYITSVLNLMNIKVG